VGNHELRRYLSDPCRNKICGVESMKAFGRNKAVFAEKEVSES
jgi:hypothetical protein